MRQSSGGASSAAPSLLMHGGGGRVDSSNDLFTRDDEYLLGGGGRDGLTGGGVGRAGTALSESSSEGFILRPGSGGATSGGGAGAGGRGSYNPSAVSEALLSGIGRGPIISSSTSSPSLQSLQQLSGEGPGADRFDSFEGGGGILSDDRIVVEPRSQSAAPEFGSSQGGLSGTHRAPPGIGVPRGGSAGSKVGGGGSVGGKGGGDGSIIFDRGTSIMETGMRRPASTGVIGQPNPPQGGVSSGSSSVMASLGLIQSSTTSSSAGGGTARAVGGAVRPAPKTLMDLIQEDYPPKSMSPEEDSFPPAKTLSSEFGVVSSEQRQQQAQQQRPSTASPPPMQGVYHQHQQQSKVSQQQDPQPRRGVYQQQQRDDMGGLSQSMDQLQIGDGEPSVFSNGTHSGMYVVAQHASQLQQNQHVSTGAGASGLSASAAAPRLTVISQQGQQHHQQPMYTTGPNGHPVAVQPMQPPMNHQMAPQAHHAVPHHHQPAHRQTSYEAQTIYYSTQQPQGGVAVEAGAPPQVHSQIVQPVYLNNAPFGYATVQYHPGPLPPHHQHQHPTRHMMHVPQQGHPQEQQYIAVMPLHQGSSPQMATTNGGYAYYQHPPDIGPGGTGHAPQPTVTILNTTHTPQVVPAPIALQQGGGSLGSSPSGPSRYGQRGKTGGSSREGSRNQGERGSGSKGRRGGGGGRRGGGGGSASGMDHHHHSPHGKHPASAGGSGIGGGGAPSSLLEEFRSARNRVWTVDDIQGHVVEFCQDQNGSRFIQQRLEIANPDEMQIVMAEVLPAVRKLRNDVFGNYVVQKLLEHGTVKMKVDIRDTLRGEMMPLSLQMYGCRVVQKALEALDDDDIPSLLAEFHGNVLSCIHDQNGNHVMQKCIEVMSSKAHAATNAGDLARADFFSGKIQFVVDDVLDNVAALSCHPYGCRVLQRILEHCVDIQKTHALDEIALCHRVLLDDQYGNYVIQHVLQFGRESDRDSILGIVVEGGLLTLSRQKFASNVVEKLLQYGSEAQRNSLVREMLKFVDDTTGEEVGQGEGGSSVVLLMVRDAYANYVVQTTLDVLAEGEERRLLLEELNANSTQLRNYTFAKHIVTKLGS